MILQVGEALASKRAVGFRWFSWVKGFGFFVFWVQAITLNPCCYTPKPLRFI